MYDKPITCKKDVTTGYLYFMDKTHPLASTIGKVYYHRHVASIAAKGWLKTNEHVHHINGDRSNNDTTNLVVLTRAQHHGIHGLQWKTGCQFTPEIIIKLSDSQIRFLRWLNLLAGLPNRQNL